MLWQYKFSAPSNQYFVSTNLFFAKLSLSHRLCIPALWTDCIICLRFVFSVYRWKKSSNKNATSVLNSDYILLTKAQIRKIKAIYYLQLLKLKVIKCHYFSIRVLTAELWPFFVIFKENQVFAQFLLHKQIELPKMGLHTKKQVFISKKKKKWCPF